MQSIIEEIRDLLEEGQVDRAEERLGEACGRNTRDPEELKALAELCEQMGAVDRARDIYLKLVLISPGKEAQKSLASCCIQSGWNEHAAIVLDRILEGTSDDKEILAWRADLYRAEEDWKSASSHYMKAHELDNGNVDYLIGHLECSLRSGDVESEDSVETVCRKILELDPDNEVAREKLEGITSAREASEAKKHELEDALRKQFSFWNEAEYDSDLGIPAERIPSSLVTVIIPVKNDEACLSGQLNRLMDQNIGHGIEVLVVDRGSQENEKAVVESFDDARFKVEYISAGSCSEVEALNRGIKAAKGDYVTFSRPGNTLRNDAVLRMVKAIRSLDGCRAVFSDWATTSRPNDTFDSPAITGSVRHAAFDGRFLCRVPVATGPVLIDRKWVQELLFLHTDKISTFHEFVSRTIQAGGRVASIPEILELQLDKNRNRVQEIQNEIRSFRRVLLKDFSIGSIYRLRNEDSNHQADAWVAYGNWMLEEIQGPADKYPSDEMDLAAQCYRRALEFRPLHDGAIQNLAIVSAALGQLEDVLSHVEKLPKHKQEQLLADIETYRRNFEKSSVPVQHEPSQYTDGWTGKSEPEGFPVPSHENDNRDEESDTHPSKSVLRTPVRWLGRFFDESPESAAGIEWTQLISEGADSGICHIGKGYSHQFVHSLPSEVRRKLYSMNERYGDLSHGIAVYQGIDEETRLLPDADYHIGIAFGASSRLQPGVVRKYNQLDEIWVANNFLKDVLLNSGVEQRKIQRMPLAVDDNFFRADFSGTSGFTPENEFQFLTIVDDPHRCGLDLTLKAFHDRFGDNENVSLWIYVSGSGEKREANLSAVNTCLSSNVDSAASIASRVRVLSEEIPWRELPGLFNAASAVVLPYRHEAFGIEVARAICCEKPVVTTNHGGATAFAEGDNLELVSFQFTEAPESAGGVGNWVEPDFGELTAKLSLCVNQHDVVKGKASAAASEFANGHGLIVVREQLEDRLIHIENKLVNPTLEPVQVIRTNPPATTASTDQSHHSEPDAQCIQFEGTVAGFGPVSVFNRNLSNGLNKSAGYQLVSTENGEASEPVDRSILIRNQDSPRFSKPSQGRWIHMHDWTLGRIPQDWVPSLAHADEIWVTSEAQRRAYVDSGIDPSKLVVIPAGVDTQVFNTSASPMEIDGRRTFRFLYIGDGHWQRGADILLGAYYQTFRGKANVELVVVDTETAKQQSGLKSLVDQFKSKLEAPAIRYLKGDFSDMEYAGLYRACQCFVYPYRTEAMGLRVLEAMACGLPVVVTGGGATDDFVADDFGYRVPSVRRWVGSNLNNLKLVGRGFYMEADSAALGAEMTHVLYHTTKAQAVGQAAAAWVAENRSWDQTLAKAIDRLNLMSRKPLQKDSTSVQCPQFNDFWREFESRVESGEIEAAWQYMYESVEESPFNPDACHGLLQLAISNGWNAEASAIRSWMIRWMPREVALDLYPEDINPEEGNAAPKWATLPAAVFESKELSKLSVVIEGSTFDENVQATLAPVSELAHQIVICGKDNSPDFGLLEDFEAEWMREDQNIKRSELRNRIVAKCTGDWVLFLKPGEVLKNSQLAQLAQAISESGVIAGYFPRIIYHGGSKRSREFALRLFRNAPGLEFTGESLESLSGEWEALKDRWDLHIAHEVIYLEAHEEPVSQLSTRDSQRRIQLEALVARYADDPRLRLNLGEELEASGQIKDAVEQYTEILRLLSRQSIDANTPALVETTVTNLAMVHLNNKEWNQVLELFQHPLVRRNGLTSSMHYIKGKAYLGLGATDEAMAEFTKSWSKKDDNSYSMPVEELSDGNLESRIHHVISEAGFPKKAAAWDQFARSQRNQDQTAHSAASLEQQIISSH